MSDNLVIVALPAADERVWKISSEKVPHLTLCFLGPANDPGVNVEGIVEFVQHAVDVAQHGPVMLDVDYRGILGPDQADVLYFRKGYSTKWLEIFRNQLLQNNDIKKAYESVPNQYPVWQPHLTLGYPATPAKVDDSEHGIGWVSFDRIAVWTGNFTGPEFRLQWPESNFDDAVGWSGMATLNEARRALGVMTIEHHGVKGMKWGVRKSDVTSAAKSAGQATVGAAKVAGGAAAKGAKAVGRALGDHQFEQNANKLATIHLLVNTASDRTKREDLPKINAKYAGQAKIHKDVMLIGTSQNKTQKAYRNEVRTAYRKHLDAVASEQTNTSGTRQYKISDTLLGPKNSPTMWKVTSTKIVHAATDLLDEFFIEVKFDANGFITDFVPHTTIDAMAQTADLGVEFLEHHGIKGMKWGVRKPPPSAVPTSAMSIVPHNSHLKTQIKVSGGENHPAHPDAIQVAEARAKLTKSGAKALSNKELEQVAKRLDLEGRVNNLTKSSGQKFVTNLFKTQGQQTINRKAQQKIQSQFG